MPPYSLSSLVSPSDDIEYNELSESQRRAFDTIKYELESLRQEGWTLKDGIIIIGAWGSGKSQLVRVLLKERLVHDMCVYERGRIFHWVTRDKDLKKTKTLERLLESLKPDYCEICVLDNPDVPVGSMVTQLGALNFTRYVIEQATFGKLPYLVVTLNEATWSRIRREPMVAAKIAQHFDIIELKWKSDELVKAIEHKLRRRQQNIDINKAKHIAKFCKTPRAAIVLYRKFEREDPSKFFRVFIEEGVIKAFETYIKIISQPGYKLSKVRSTPRWIHLWRDILRNIDEYHDYLDRLINGHLKSLSDVPAQIRNSYNRPHWATYPLYRWGMLTKDIEGYRFSDEFLAVAADFVAGFSEEAKLVLVALADNYAK